MKIEKRHASEKAAKPFAFPRAWAVVAINGFGSLCSFAVFFSRISRAAWNRK